MEETISTVECAERKGVTRQAIAYAIRRGDLPAQKIGRDWRIKVSDCEAYNPIGNDYVRMGERNAGRKKTPRSKNFNDAGEVHSE